MYVHNGCPLQRVNQIQHPGPLYLYLLSVCRHVILLLLLTQSSCWHPAAAATYAIQRQLLLTQSSCWHPAASATYAIQLLTSSGRMRAFHCIGNGINVSLVLERNWQLRSSETSLFLVFRQNTNSYPCVSHCSLLPVQVQSVQGCTVHTKVNKWCSVWFT